MEIKQIRIGDIVTPNNVFLAPLAGYTDYCFRNPQLELGIGLSFTELTSAKGIVYNSRGNASLLSLGGEDLYDRTAVQLFGCDPYYLRKACEDTQLEKFKIVDINMGCPVPKVYKNGEGSALLKDVLLAEKVIKECVKSGKTITIKIRTGLKEGDDVAKDFAMMAENAGAKLITIHGRVREKYYSGEVDFNAIEKAKNSVSIPVIANGGIFTVNDANEIMDKTGADGVMLARGAIENPFLVCELLGTTPKSSLKEFILKHLTNMEKAYGTHKSAVWFRKFIPYYFKSKKNFKDIKLKMQATEDVESLRNIIEDLPNLI